jgi:glutathione reductase (NADPH)
MVDLRSCVIRGCVPKKLLVYGSHVAEELADAQGLGWTTQGTHNWNDLVARKASAVHYGGGSQEHLQEPQQ